jgi:hypothetical protein
MLQRTYDVLTTVTVPFSVMVIGRSVVTVAVVVSVPVVVVVVDTVEVYFQELVSQIFSLNQEY